MVNIRGFPYVFASPLHPYTRGLLDTADHVDPGDGAGVRPSVAPLGGETPSAADPPSGCRFCTRCPQARDLCARGADARRTGRAGARGGLPFSAGPGCALIPLCSDPGRPPSRAAMPPSRRGCSPATCPC
ncbi:oligopeptide/dipeptide ABC transporter ATP-binding protein [Streptomyces sp. BRA346]|uniref:oligopeptide/dipeptide ABC transporter ATP-binding protein n=1 Tax=Streptomyces sp. BRA346 TaxID=2878199 RepID=UPI0040630C53